MLDPYRTPASRVRARPSGDRDLWAVWAIAWAAAAAHAAAAVLRHATWGAGTTIAGLLVVALPWVLARERLNRRRTSR